MSAVINIAQVLDAAPQNARSNLTADQLRDVTKSVNAQNQRRAHSNNTAGLLGVVAKKDGFFVANITVQGSARYLGSFKDSESASSAYLKAKRELHEGCTI